MAMGNSEFEDCIRLDERAQTLRTLGEAVMKFTPDLGKELAARWAKAQTEQSENLERFLAVLRQEN